MSSHLTDPHLCDETGRLRALERYGVLDTPVEAPFEKVVGLVEQVLAVPMCAVSLVDHHRLWFKAQRGLGICETARDTSFCTHAIETPTPFIVRDALEDDRFRESPLVTGAPYIRAYAGVPLRTPDGYQIGTLCAMDTKPRPFPETEINILERFASLVVDELELRQIASVDALTGVATRRAWMDAANRELARARRTGHPFSVLLLDIDHFKEVNDTHGHPAGDEVLKAVAATATAESRQADVVGRLGGEEFALLISNTDRAAGLTQAERLRAAIQALTVPIEGRTLTVTASFGLADFMGRDDTVETLLSRADLSLYRAKRTGRNRVVAAGAPADGPPTATAEDPSTANPASGPASGPASNPAATTHMA